MSRWNNKNRVQSFAFPLESLAKEKENTNRPIAARSAGTVGKWGTTSFTSIRTPTYGYASFSPKQDAVNPNISPQSGDGNVTPNAPVPVIDAPKPKKFFKSRNFVPDTTVLPPQPSLPPSAPVIPSHHVEKVPKLNLKLNKKIKIDAADKSSAPKTKTDKTKTEKVKPEKPKTKKASKPKEKGVDKVSKVKSTELPTRVLSRTRKTVNYSENRSRSPSPRMVQSPAIEDTDAPNETFDTSIESSNRLSSVEDVDSASLHQVDEQKSHLTIDLPAQITSEQSLEITAVVKTINDHPPIVLRISKGTSRLISTDSDEPHSPPYQSPIARTPPTVVSTAELIAVLSDDLASNFEPVATPEICTESKNVAPCLPSDDVVVPESFPTFDHDEKSKPIKIKIKTSSVQIFSPTNSQSTRSSRRTKTVPAAVVTESTKILKTRASRRGKTKLEEQPTSATTETVTEDFELYRTLASHSADEKDGCDSQSSNLGSISSTFAVGVLEDSHVICSRGSSGVTSDPETSQDSVMATVAPNFEINNRLDGGVVEMVETYDPPVEIPVEIQVKPQTPPPELPVSPPKRATRRQAKSPPLQTTPQLVKETGRVTRNNQNGTLPAPIEATVRPLITKSYGRKRKQASEIVPEPKALSPTTTIDEHDVSDNIVKEPPLSFRFSQQKLTPAKSYGSEAERKKLKKSSYTDDSAQTALDSNNSTREANVNNNLDTASAPSSSKLIDDDKPNVKFVISKKKGSIFKSRATETSIGETSKPKRHVYKHKWDDEKDKSSNLEAPQKSVAVDAFYDEFDDEDGEAAVGGSGSGGSLTRVVRKRVSPSSLVDFESEEITGVRCDSKAKTFYTVVRNVKMAHQIQEIGEFQEMDDDVEYILDALQATNPMATRCLSAIQLACKCMEPAFRMHVRAHGTITRFFKALNDATNTQSLGLCTATVMFVLNQDNMSMDLDRDSLSLMLSLLESDASHRDALDNCGLTVEQLQRNTQKVRDICSEIKSQGKAVHLNLDNITVGTLAMETLLSLTSKQAGDWFKEELRTLGGLEKIIETICECCRQISDYVVDWTNSLLEKLRKIERCLRVLELVSTQNEQNTSYILTYKEGYVVDSLVNFYKLCDREIALYPTTDQTPKDNPGVVLREALVPTLKVLVNLTQPFCAKALGSEILGQKRELFDTSLHLLLQATHYVPERCIFELSILVLLLLINLTTYTTANRVIVMEASAPSDFGNQFDKVPAIKALIEYFYNCEELARLVEKNTDAILDNPNKSERKGQSQDDMEETVSKLLTKASHHMEHTMIASYVCLLVGHLIMDSAKHQKKVREFLKDGSFTEMSQILEKYYNFLNLTANAEAAMVAHIKQTKKIIDYFQQCEQHSNSPDHAVGKSRTPSPAPPPPPPKKTFNRSYANSSAAAAAAVSNSASHSFFSSR